MEGSRVVRVVMAGVLLAAVFGVTLYAAARVGPFVVLLGVAVFGIVYVAMRMRHSRAGRTPSRP